MTIDELVEIAKEVEIGDPFDWGNVNIHEESAYRLMAMGVMGMDMSEDVNNFSAADMMRRRQQR